MTKTNAMRLLDAAGIAYRTTELSLIHISEPTRRS